MDDHYFLTPKTTIVECKKHGKQGEYFKLGHRYFCLSCVGDHLEKAIGQVRVTHE